MFSREGLCPRQRCMGPPNFSCPRAFRVDVILTSGGRGSSMRVATPTGSALSPWPHVCPAVQMAAKAGLRLILRRLLGCTQVRYQEVLGRRGQNRGAFLGESGRSLAGAGRNRR